MGTYVLFRDMRASQRSAPFYTIAPQHRPTQALEEKQAKIKSFGTAWLGGHRTESSSFKKPLASSYQDKNGETWGYITM